MFIKYNCVLMIQWAFLTLHLLPNRIFWILSFPLFHNLELSESRDSTYVFSIRFVNTGIHHGQRLVLVAEIFNIIKSWIHHYCHRYRLISVDIQELLTITNRRRLNRMMKKWSILKQKNTFIIELIIYNITCETGGFG